MINKCSPESGLAQRWAPRLRAIFSIVLCILVLFCCVPFEVSAASSTNNYWYNGVELPPLPTTSIPKDSFILSTGSIIYLCLVDSSHPFYYDSTTGRIECFNNSSNERLITRYTFSSNSWTSASVFSAIGLADRSIIWSSVDIPIDDTENLFYSSNSSPIPYSQKEIYSYNDLIAPSIFNLNTISYLTKYYIWQDKNTFDYYAYTFWDSNGWDEDNNRYEHDDLVDYYYASVRYKLVDGVWAESYSITGSYNIDFSQYEIVWSSVDLTDTSDNIKYEGSDAVLLGNLTSLYTVLPEDDIWEVKQGSTKRFELASGQNLPVETVTWQLKGNIVSGTSIDYNGLLTVSSNQPLGTIYVVASNINGEGYSSEAAVTVLPEQTPSTDWVIRSNYSGTFYAGNNYSFYLYNPSTSQSGASAVWSIYSPNTLSSGTTISSSGVLTVASDQGPAEITIQASSINGEDEYSTYTIFVFTSGTGGGGDTPTPTPTPGTQDVIDSIDEGFTGLGNKLDNLGDSIIGGLLEGLLRLFVPTSEELSEKMDEFKAWIDEKIPILAVPVALVQYTYDMFFGVTPELGVLTFPEIKWMDNVLIQETELNLAQYTWLSDLLPIIRTVMTAGCCLAFVHWITGKVKEVGKS